MQTCKLYVGNIPYSTTNSELNELFSRFGTVKEVKVIEGKGFAFVEMAEIAQAEEAKNNLNNQDFKGRTLRIDEARPRESRPPRRDGEGGGGGYKRDRY
ncbi:MAG: RNA-binding protein [Candidatus Wallbacteria bacterium]|nr:RNA-binding protein [Candidatus Wallbacteria bacterium]